MKISVLTENTASSSEFLFEHGLSLLVETSDRKILFDSGQSDLFSKNAAAMGIDLKTVDMAVLSHGHYDHGGGLSCFLHLNPKAPVYMSEYAFEPHYNANEKYIGLDTSTLPNERFLSVSGEITLSNGITIIPWGNEIHSHPIDCASLSVMENGQLIPDDFRHEIYMLVEENGKKILFSGCSHKGILNIVHRFKPDVLVGGFHFMKLDPNSDGREHLLEQAAQLCAYHTKYYTCHCTGVEQYELLRSAMGEKLKYLSAGMVVEL